MQSAAFAAAGLPWTYELLDVSSEELPQVVSELRSPAWRGANVTIPHKLAVAPLLDRLDGEAVATGAVNTIHREGDRLVGSNTDVLGIRAALAAVGFEPSGGVAVVLGAGGSARAASAALAGAKVTFVARDPGRATSLAAEILAWDDPEWRRRVRRADLLLNATPLGRQGEMPVGLDDLPARGSVIDLVYVRGGTPLVRASRQLGLGCVDGWAVLLAQGVAAFEAWTGRPAPAEAMEEALERGGGGPPPRGHLLQSGDWASGTDSSARAKPALPGDARPSGEEPGSE